MTNQIIPCLVPSACQLDATLSLAVAQTDCPVPSGDNRAIQLCAFQLSSSFSGILSSGLPADTCFRAYLPQLAFLAPSETHILPEFNRDRDNQLHRIGRNRDRGIRNRDRKQRPEQPEWPFSAASTCFQQLSTVITHFDPPDCPFCDQLPVFGPQYPF